ncbi:hypothetical protein H7I53_03360, partial [Mycolicibacterium pulveris]|nr:hypothetical protein [Mycolicibacterium pulveris]
MFDPIYIANSVAGWTALGVKLPKELARAVEVLDAIRLVETGHPVVFGITDVTPDNVEEKIRELANQLLPTMGIATRVGATDLSALETAKRQALNLAARDVLTKAGAAVPGIIKQLEPRFDAAVAEFTEAVLALPDDLSDAAIVRGGP